MNKKKKAIGIIFLIVVFISSVALGFLEAKSLGINFFEEKVHNVDINSEDDIIAMGTSFHNNICTLEKDVVISGLNTLTTRELPFVGVFDGNGHKITFTGDVEKSLFGYIGKGGIVKNLQIEVDAVNIVDKNAAILALENEGTIMNCKVTVNSAKVSVAGNHAALVTTNKGTIKNVVVKSTFENASSPESHRRSIIGGVVAYNYGEINSCVCETSFVSYPETVKDNIFSGAAVNNSVGAVYGVNNGKIENCVAIVTEDLYVSDNKNKNIKFVTEENRFDVFNEATIFGVLEFDPELWLYVNNEFNLIQGED